MSEGSQTAENPLRVIVSGTGKMGREIVAGVSGQPDMRVVGVLEKFAESDRFRLPSGDEVPQSADPRKLFSEARADVVVDFTFHEWTELVAPAALAAGVRPVIGTSGLPEHLLGVLARDCSQHRIGAVVAANFALGAVLLMHLCSIAAPFFDYAEVIELHHEQKADAPSGTAVATVRDMLQSRGRPFHHPETTKVTLPGTRGGLEGGVERDVPDRAAGNAELRQAVDLQVGHGRGRRVDPGPDAVSLLGLREGELHDEADTP